MLQSRRSFLGVLAGTAAVSLASAATRPKRIGFVDDNPDNFHANTYLRLIRTDLKERGFDVAGVTALQKDAGRRWAAKNGVPWFDSVEELNDRVDYYAVLAPSTPHTHLPLCKQVLPYGKPTFVDKTFAPSAKVAEQIFALADRYKTPVQTSSALRYTNVQDFVRKTGEEVRHIVTWGGGRSFDEYAVHPLELAISCMGPQVTQVMRRGREPEVQLLLDFDGGRTAVVNVYTQASTPFAAAVSTRRGTRYVAVDTRTLFLRACAAMLDFFEAGSAQVDRRETMAIMRVLDAARDPASEHRFLPV